MVIDTSALLTILFSEAEAPRMLRAIRRAERRLVGAPTLVEAGAILTARKGSAGEIALDALLHRLGLEVVPFSPEAARLARLGYARFGKGAGDPAVLNLGDCFSYGTAMAEREPLLFKGDDFNRTDILAVPY